MAEDKKKKKKRGYRAIRKAQKNKTIKSLISKEEKRRKSGKGETTIQGLQGLRKKVSRQAEMPPVIPPDIPKKKKKDLGNDATGIKPKTGKRMSKKASRLAKMGVVGAAVGAGLMMKDYAGRKPKKKKGTVKAHYTDQSKEMKYGKKKTKKKVKKKWKDPVLQAKAKRDAAEKKTKAYKKRMKKSPSKSRSALKDALDKVKKKVGKRNITLGGGKPGKKKSSSKKKGMKKSRMTKVKTKVYGAKKSSMKKKKRSDIYKPSPTLKKHLEETRTKGKKRPLKKKMKGSPRDRMEKKNNQMTRNLLEEFRLKNERRMNKSVLKRLQELEDSIE